MTVDLAKARALVEPLLGASYALPSDARGWFDHPTAGHVPHNVCTDAADTLAALLDEREHLIADARSWEQQASDRVDDCNRFIAERDALARDAARFDWYFGPDVLKPADFMSEYLRGVREQWTPDQWRAAIDAAMKGASDES